MCSKKNNENKEKSCLPEDRSKSSKHIAKINLTSPKHLPTISQKSSKMRSKTSKSRKTIFFLCGSPVYAGSEIFTVSDEESESEVKDLEILHPDSEITENHPKEIRLNPLSPRS